MNIWKRFLSFVLAFALVAGLLPAVPVVLADGESASELKFPGNLVWDFDDGTANGITMESGYAVENGALVWKPGLNDTAGTYGTAYGKYNGYKILLDGVTGEWNDFMLTVDVTATHNSSTHVTNGTALNQYAMAGIVLFTSASSYLQVRVRPSTTSGGAYVYVYQNGTSNPLVNGTNFDIDSTAASTKAPVSFNLGAMLEDGVLSVLLDGKTVWSGEVTSSGTPGLMTWASSTSATTQDSVTYDNLTVQPIPTETVIYENDCTTGFTTTDWTTALSYTDGKGVAMSGTSYYKTDSVNDGWVTATVALPTLDSATIDQIVAVGTSGTSNVQYSLYMSNNHSTLQVAFDILFNRGSGKTTLRMDVKDNAFNGTRYWDKHTIDLTKAQSATFWDAEKPITIKMRTVGNYLEAVVTQNDEIICKHGIAVTADTSSEYELVNTDTQWYFGIYGSIGKIYTDAEKTNQITTPAYLQNVEIGSMNKVAAVTVDGDTVSLPAYKDPSGSATITRTTYQIGEVIELSLNELADPATLKANGEAIGSNYTIPTGVDSVVITCSEYVNHDVTVDSAVSAGITLEETSYLPGSEVKVTVDEDLIVGNSLVVTGASGTVEVTNNGDGTYSFTMPNESVTITATLKEVYVPEVDYNGTPIAWVDPDATEVDADLWNVTSGAATVTDGKLSSANTLAVKTKTAAENGYIEAKISLQESAMADLAVTTTKYGGGLAARWVSGSEMLVRFMVTKTVPAEGEATYTAKLQFVDRNGAKYAYRNPGSITSEYVLDGFAWDKEYTIRLETFGNYARVLVDGEVAFEAIMPGARWDIADGFYAVSHTGGAFAVTYNELVAAKVDSYAVAAAEGVTTDEYAQMGDSTMNTLVARDYYRAGETVTFTLAENLDPDTLVVTGATTNLTVENGGITDNGDGAYTFTMPAEAVVITCKGQTLENEQVFDDTVADGLTTDEGWSADYAANADGVLDAPSGQKTVYWDTAMESGWISVTYQMPATNPLSSSAQALVIANHVSTGANIEYGLLMGASKFATRGYIREGSSASGYDACFYPKETSVSSGGWGETYTLTMRKVGNYITVETLENGTQISTASYTLDANEALGSGEFKLGIQIPVVSGMTVTAVEVGRYNNTVSVSVAEGDENFIYTGYEIASNASALSTPAWRTTYKCDETVDVYFNGKANQNTLTYTTDLSSESVAITNGALDLSTLDGVSSVVLACDGVEAPEADYEGGEVIAWADSSLGSFADGGLVSSSTYTFADGVLTTGSAAVTASVSGEYIHATFKMDITLPEGMSASGNIAYLYAKVDSDTYLQPRIRCDSAGAAPYLELVFFDGSSGGYGAGANNRNTVLTGMSLGTKYTVELTRIGNFVSISISDGTDTTTVSWNLNASYDIAADAMSFSLGTAAVADIKLENIVFTSYDGAIYVAEATGALLDGALEPNTGAAQDSTDTTVETFSRTHYRVGETVSFALEDGMDPATLTYTGIDATDVTVNGTSGSFEMPASDVTVTCEAYTYYSITESVDGLEVDVTSAKENATVTVTLDDTLDYTTLKVTYGETVLTVGDGITAADDGYTFTMPAGDVTVTCAKIVLADNESIYTATTLTSTYTSTYSDWKNGWVTAQIQLPTVSEETHKSAVIAYNSANGNVSSTGTHGNYVIYAKIGSYQCYAGIYLLRNSSTANFRLYVPTDMSGNSSSIAYVELSSTDLAEMFYNGKVATVEIRKVGNLIQAAVKDGDTVIVDHAFTVAAENTNFSDADTVAIKFTQDGTFYTTYDSETNTMGGEVNIATASVTSVEIGRINNTVSVSVDEGSSELVSLPTHINLATITKTSGTGGTELARTAYQVGEVLELTVAKNYVAYVGDSKISNPTAFEVPSTGAVITAKLDLDPYYTSDMSGAIDDIFSSHTDGYTIEDGKLKFSTVAGGTNYDGAAMVTLPTIDATSYVANVAVTAYQQVSATDGSSIQYPWIGLQLNGHTFRVHPSLTSGAMEYAIKAGSSWMNPSKTSTPDVLSIPGGLTANDDGSITYQIAVLVTPGTTDGQTSYALYINGYKTVSFEVDSTDMQLGVFAAKRGQTIDSVAHTGNNGVTVYFDDLAIDQLGAPETAVFGEKQLTLNEDLSLDYHIALPEDSAAVTAVFAMDGETLSEVTLANAERRLKKVALADGIVLYHSWYVVTANIPAKDINSTVTLTLVDASGNAVDAVVASNNFAAAENGAYDYAVEDYAVYLYTNSTDETVKATAGALLDYGTITKAYFASMTGDDKADSYYTDGLESVTVDNLATYAPSSTGSIENITIYGASLVAEEETHIKIYFRLLSTSDWDDVTVTVKMGDEEVTNWQFADTVTGYKCVMITGIHAADLDTVYTVTLTKGDSSITVNYSGLSYAYSAMTKQNASGNLVRLGQAIYKYWEAAQAMSN